MSRGKVPQFIEHLVCPACGADFRRYDVDPRGTRNLVLVDSSAYILDVHPGAAAPAVHRCPAPVTRHGVYVVCSAALLDRLK